MAAFVRHFGNSNSTASSSSDSTGIPNLSTSPAGNLLIARMVCGGTTRDLTSVVDTGAPDTFSRLSTGANTVEDWLYAAVLDAPLTYLDLDSVQFNWDAANALDRCWAVDEFSGVTATEDVASATATGSSASPSAGPITPLSPQCLMLGFCSVNGGIADTFTEDSDSAGGDTWHTLTRVEFSGGPTSNLAYKITKSAVAQTYNPTITSRAWVCSLVALTGGPVRPNRSRGQAVNRSASY